MRNHPRALLLQTNEWIGLDAEPWVLLLAASDDRGTVDDQAEAVAAVLERWVPRALLSVCDVQLLRGWCSNYCASV